VLTVTITDEQWEKILPLLRAHPNVYVGKEQECRRFLSAVLWIARSGAQWRQLPAEYGYWNTIYRRFTRWAQQGVFDHLHQAFGEDPDIHHVLVNPAFVNAYIFAAWVPKRRGR
jgi:transposase